MTATPSHLPVPCLPHRETGTDIMDAAVIYGNEQEQSAFAVNFQRSLLYTPIRASA